MIVRLLSEKTTKRMLITLFICIGVSAMGLRWLYFGSNQLSKEDTIWKISIHGQFDVTKGSTTISFQKPKTGRKYKLISQRLYHPGFSILSAKQSKAGYARAKATRTGTADLIIDYHVQLSHAPVLQLTNSTAMGTEQREKYLQTDINVNSATPELLSLNALIKEGITSKQALLPKIFRQSQIILEETDSRYDDLTNVISDKKATPLGRAKLMVTLCRINDIPARLVCGFTLTKSELDKPYYWVEVYSEEKNWQAYDPSKGFQEAIPNYYVAFGYDSDELFSIENGTPLFAKYYLEEDDAIQHAAFLTKNQNIFDIFNLLRLDIEVRQALRLLLVLPFCVLLSAFVRHVLGFYPYGTFTAPLLALAMVYTEVVITLLIAGIVIFLSLLGRAILPKSLPRAPRLSLIFTFVAMSMVLSVSVMSYYSMNPGGNIILLPTVILVAIVDRFYSYMDDTSTHAASIRLGVTVFIALFCIPLLKLEMLNVFALTYPEVHLITAALVLIFSSYKGKKITDLKYLKLFGENKAKKKSRQKAST